MAGSIDLKSACAICGVQFTVQWGLGRAACSAGRRP